uniref:Mitochondrial ribosome-associated GTPase 1 n=1 Tax=Monodelphis domestica TaxID=13616 RepID=F7F7T9_MONDO
NCALHNNGSAPAGTGTGPGHSGMRIPAGVLWSAAGAAWRNGFSFAGQDVARWFPGHMAKGLKKMQSSLKLVDCIIEMQVARISFSSTSCLPRETLGIKPHLLVLNKMDLADLKEKQKIVGCLNKKGVKNVIFTNCIKDENIKQIVPMVTKLIESGYRYHRGENLEYCIMVIGVPNVGKSSLINSLRRQHLKKGKASPVGGHPGVTKAVMSRVQVCERPLMFLLDTPGVLTPRIQDVETGLKLATCGTILDHLVGEDIIADYLLFTLNKQQQFRYVEHYDLGEACDDIGSVLKKIAIKLKKINKVKVLTGTGEFSGDVATGEDWGSPGGGF